jgi:hypothetical protein
MLFLVLVVDDTASEGRPRFQTPADLTISASQLKPGESNSARVFAVSSENNDRKTARAKRLIILKGEPGFGHKILLEKHAE